MDDKSELIIYKSKSGDIEIKTTLKDDSIWLSQKQIASLFSVNQPAIAKHVSNIYKSGELSEEGTYSILEYMGTKGDNKKRKYETRYYNLDMIISVGYRVNSKKATDFRVWATKTLRNYLVKGYVINQNKFLEVKEIVRFITEKAKSDTLSGHEKEILDVIEKYSKTWSILGQYDDGNIKVKKGRKGKFKLNYYACRDMIDKLKDDLVQKKIVGELFGQEREQTFEAILGNLYQTFDGKDLYSSLEEKAAHLLYFVIKDHPFFDGNKRIGSLLFLSFLERNAFLFHNNGQVKINDKTIVALALLVASSDPREKNAMIRLTINLIQD